MSSAFPWRGWSRSSSGRNSAPFPGRAAAGTGMREENERRGIDPGACGTGPRPGCEGRRPIPAEKRMDAARRLPGASLGYFPPCRGGREGPPRPGGGEYRRGGNQGGVGPGGIARADRGRPGPSRHPAAGADGHPSVDGGPRGEQAVFQTASGTVRGVRPTETGRTRDDGDLDGNVQRFRVGDRGGRDDDPRRYGHLREPGKERGMKGLGFVGAGNMGEAMIRGILAAKLVPPREVVVLDIRPGRGRELSKRFGVATARGVAELVRDGDAVVFAVKPQGGGGG